MEIVETAVEQKILLPKTLDEQLIALDALGLSIKRKKAEKLLLKSNGDFIAVRDFFIASHNLKEASKKSKLEKKMAKRESKGIHEKKQRKQKQFEARSKHECRKKERDVVDNEKPWPAEGTRLFLDGNNMLYVLGPIRGLALKRNTRGAELALEAIARAFTEKMQLEKCTLIFDDTSRKVDETNFEVYSARPTFVTSDDSLVESAKKEKGVFVTSDRELIQRLEQQGGIIVSPKTWFRFVARMLSGHVVENLDEWATQWVDDISMGVKQLRV